MVPNVLFPVEGIGPFRRQLLKRNSLTNDTSWDGKGEEFGRCGTEIWSMSTEIINELKLKSELKYGRHIPRPT